MAYLELEIRLEEVPINFHQVHLQKRRLAAKAAVKYIEDQKANDLKVSDKPCDEFREIIYNPLDNYTVNRNEITGPTNSPSYISPIQGLQRLQPIMDDFF
jgi:hypothetical protein